MTKSRELLLELIITYERHYGINTREAIALLLKELKLITNDKV